MKSANCISTTGLKFSMANPTAQPKAPASMIGVLRTRSFPNCSTNPSVILNTPPYSAISCPRMIKFSSSSKACFSENWIASTKRFSELELLVSVFSVSSTEVNIRCSSFCRSKIGSSASRAWSSFPRKLWSTSSRNASSSSSPDTNSLSLSHSANRSMGSFSSHF
jgi:hypothetical protein